jgi:hypothetical protein
MIAITITGNAYAAIASTLPSGPPIEREISLDREDYRIWLPRAFVERLRALRSPGESFSDVILRLAEDERRSRLAPGSLQPGRGAKGAV